MGIYVLMKSGYGVDFSPSQWVIVHSRRRGHRVIWIFCIAYLHRSMMLELRPTGVAEACQTARRSVHEAGLSAWHNVIELIAFKKILVCETSISSM